MCIAVIVFSISFGIVYNEYDYYQEDVYVIVMKKMSKLKCKVENHFTQITSHKQVCNKRVSLNTTDHHRSAVMAELVRIEVKVKSRVRVTAKLFRARAEVFSIRVKVRVGINSSECHFG